MIGVYLMRNALQHMDAELTRQQISITHQMLSCCSEQAGRCWLTCSCG